MIDHDEKTMVRIFDICAHTRKNSYGKHMGNAGHCVSFKCREYRARRVQPQTRVWKDEHCVLLAGHAFTNRSLHDVNKSIVRGWSLAVLSQECLCNSRAPQWVSFVSFQTATNDMPVA